MNKTDIESLYGQLSFTEPYRLIDTKYVYIGNVRHKTGRKIPIIKCDVCASDPELHGEGLFVSSPKGIKNNSIGCGCSVQYKWSASQYKIRITRVAEKYGYRFIGFGEDIDSIKVNTHTKCIVECPKHGVITSAIVNSIISRETFSCKLCAYEETGERSRKPDEDIIKGFMTSGRFHEDTMFWKDVSRKNYWFYLCGECLAVGRNAHSNLRKGARSCNCSRVDQKEMYINLLYKDDIVVAIKFGLSNNSYYRMSAQNSKTTLEVKPFELWDFKTKWECWNAETEIKNKVPRNFMSREEYPDGWTETVDPQYLPDVLKIMKNNGGAQRSIVVDSLYLDGCVACVNSLMDNGRI